MTGLSALLVVWLTGALALDALRPAPQSLRAQLERLPLAFGLGAGLLHLWFLWACRWGAVSPFLGALPLAPLLLARLLRRRPLPADAAGDSRAWSAGERLLLGVLGAALLAAAALTLALPLLDWDTRILWALKAKILAAEGTVVSDAFRDPYRLHIHPRYPLLVPWLAALMAQMQGGFAEWQYQVLLLLFAGLALWQLYRLLRASGARRLALLLCLVLLCTGVWLGAIFDSSVELALVFYLLLALESLLGWLGARRLPELLLAGFFLFCLAMTKNEGVLLALCLWGALLSIQLLAGERRPALFPLGVLGGVFLLCSAVWFWHLLHIPPVSDENYAGRLGLASLRQGSGRLGAILRAAAAQALNLRQWHLLWLLPLVLPALAWGRGVLRSERFLLPLLVLLFYVAGIGVVYLLSPWRDIAMHVAVTFERVMLPLPPLLLLLLQQALAAGRAGRQRPGEAA